MLADRIASRGGRVVFIRLPSYGQVRDREEHFWPRVQWWDAFERGAGSPAHLADAITIGKADAALAASIFHFGEYSIRETKKFISQQGIPVRL